MLVPFNSRCPGTSFFPFLLAYMITVFGPLIVDSCRDHSTLNYYPLTYTTNVASAFEDMFVM